MILVHNRDGAARLVFLQPVILKLLVLFMATIIPLACGSRIQSVSYPCAGLIYMGGAELDIACSIDSGRYDCIQFLKDPESFELLANLLKETTLTNVNEGLFPSGDDLERLLESLLVCELKRQEVTPGHSFYSNAMVFGLHPSHLPITHHDYLDAFRWENLKASTTLDALIEVIHILDDADAAPTWAFPERIGLLYSNYHELSERRNSNNG